PEKCEQSPNLAVVCFASASGDSIGMNLLINKSYFILTSSSGDTATPPPDMRSCAQFQDAMIGACRQIHLRHRRPHQTLTIIMQSWVSALRLLFVGQRQFDGL